MFSLINSRSFFNDFDSIFDSYGLNKVYDSIKNDDGSISISVDLPGVLKEDLDVETKDYVINVSAKRTKGGKEEIKRAFTISKRYNLDTLSGDLSDGVLTLTIKPYEETKSKKILIGQKP